MRHVDYRDKKNRNKQTEIKTAKEIDKSFVYNRSILSENGMPHKNRKKKSLLGDFL